MAKRSIEIAISATNQTAAGLSGAKAELQRWAGDVKRIQENVRAATKAGDIAAAGGQQALLGGALERKATAMQAAEGQAALQQRLAAAKAEHAAIRQSVMATGQVAANSRQIATEAGKGAEGFEKQAGSALKLGKAVLAAHLVASGIRLTTAAISGDWEAMGETVRRLPFGIGDIAGATEELLLVISGARAEMDAMLKATAIQGEHVAGMTKLGDIREKSDFAAKLARMDDEGARLAQAEQRRKEMIDKIWATPGTKKSKELAEAAVRDEFRANEEKRDREQDARIAAENAAQEEAAAEAGWEAKMRADEQVEQQEKSKAERRLAMEKDTAEEIARLKIETSTTGLAREIALLDHKRQTELDNAELTEAMKSKIREKYGLREAQIRQGYRETAGPEYRDLRAPGGGVAAQDAGYLTGAGRHSAEGQAITQMSEMVRSLKKIETRGVTVEAAGEFLEWLRKNAPAAPAAI